MNKQEIFDTVVTHLRKQGKRASSIHPNGDTGCMYRTSDGLKCAAGCLIPDEDYNLEFEGFAIDDHSAALVVRYFSNKFGSAERDLIGELQTTHDFSEPQDWELRWQSIANEHGLKLPPKGQS